MIGRIALTVVALGVGFALGAYATGDDEVPPSPVTVNSAPAATAPPNPFVPRDRDTGLESVSLTGLAAQLRDETLRRERLEAQLVALQATVERMATQMQLTESSASAPQTADNQSAAVDPEDLTPVSEAALVAAGFRQELAAELKRHVDQLALDRLFLRDRAMRENWFNTPRYREEAAKLDSQETALRDRLGEAGYDRFLYATGVPNRVVIRSVMEGSPAQQAGLRGGDLLLSYDRARVFSWSDLRAGIMEGDANELVSVEVERDDQRLEILLPRGPLGVRLNTARVAP